jgi:hypothetical protein
MLPKKRSHSKTRPALLSVEVLESRNMLSTVSIFAQGDTGQESMDLIINNNVVATFDNVSVENREYTYSTEEGLTADQISIAFTNDFYDAENEIDRNLTVDRIVIDGESFESESPESFVAGWWSPVNQAIVSGNIKVDTLHTNGYIQYGTPQPQVSEVDFAGRTWEVVGGATSSLNLGVQDFGGGFTLLGLGGGSGPLAVSTQVDAQGGSRYDLTLNAYRDIFAGAITENGPWATVGVNYYDPTGFLVGQDRVDVNSSSRTGNQVYSFETPENATTAYLWAWVDNYEPGFNIPLMIENVQWQQDTPPPVDDFEAPNASFNSYEFDRNAESLINFGVNFTDNVRLAQISQGAITVTGPNGFQETPPIAIGAPDNTETDQTLVFFITAPSGEWAAADNGVYTVALNDNAVADAAGNFAAGGDLGTITVNIDPPAEDTTPPVVALLSSEMLFTETPTSGRGSDITFGITYEDDQRLGPLGQDRILVTGPNGYSGFARGIAGGSLGTNGTWEQLYVPLPADGVWSSNDNGLYTVSLVANSVSDFAGNFTPAQLLGTFEVRLASTSVG